MDDTKFSWSMQPNKTHLHEETSVQFLKMSATSTFNPGKLLFKKVGRQINQRNKTNTASYHKKIEKQLTCVKMW